MKRLITYLKASKAELEKVAWPSRKQVRDHSIAVIAVSLFVAAFLGAIDFGLQYLVTTIL